MSTITKETKVKQVEDILSTTVDDSVVFMSIETGNYYSSNDVAQRVWELIEERKTVSELVNKLLEEYEVEEETCINDILALLDQMSEENLIELS